MKYTVTKLLIFLAHYHQQKYKVSSTLRQTQLGRSKPPKEVLHGYSCSVCNTIIFFKQTY